VGSISLAFLLNWCKNRITSFCSIRAPRLARIWKAELKPWPETGGADQLSVWSLARTDKREEPNRSRSFSKQRTASRYEQNRTFRPGRGLAQGGLGFLVASR
jgi:hypothetical protein